MLTISSVNSSNINAIQNRQSKFNPFSFAPARFSSNNLAPLACDTVSFTGGKKKLEYNDDEDKTVGGINKTTAIGIAKEAEFAKRYLEYTLNNILGDMVRPEKGIGSQSKPIKSITCRVKEPDSIVEKSITRKLDSAKEVKEGMTDIVGARIVMADSSRQGVDSVINRFTKAVQSNQIKILEIENYRPDPEINSDGVITKSYDYGSPKALKDLKLACDDKLGRSIRKSDEDVESGYMAIHMLIQLPSGFTGEIQIIGSEVEKLKDIEDICFKYKNNKTIKNLPSKLKKNLSPLADKKNDILRKEYNIYTRQAYLYQREKEFIQNPKNRNNEFLHIPDFLPEKLDFNSISKGLNGENS